jgi:hypothetical protein
VSHRKKLIKAALTGLALLLPASLEVRAQKPLPATQFPPPPKVEVHIDANPRVATVGDPIQIDMDITMPQGCQAEIPRIDAHAGDFSIVDFFPGPALPPTGKQQAPAKSGQPQPGAPAHHQARIVIAIYKTGRFAFPSIPIKIKTAEGKEIAASSPPVDIEIRSVIAEKNPVLKDLKKQAEIPEPTRWLLWITLAAAACALCATGWYLWRRRRNRPVALTPAQTQDLLNQAEADLRNLLARGLPESGTEKRFYVLLSEIVKRILEAGYGIHTAEQTTSEIMDVLNRISVPDSDGRSQIESFLIRCDVVKFARYIPSKIEHEAASQDALRILAEARKAVVSR